MAPAEAETWLSIARALQAAPYGERAALLARHAATLGVSIPTAYRRLAEVGWSSGRKPREDKGTSKLGAAAAERVALHVASGISKRGQCRTPVTEAVRHLQDRGELDGVSVSTVNRRLRVLGLDRRAMTAHKSTIQRESLHPNHVWEVDVSTCLTWYFRDEKGKPVLTRRSAEEIALLYEGKRERLAGLRQVILRYLAIDHTTGAHFPYYFHEAGENALSMAEFLYLAMAPKGELYGTLGGDPELMDRAFPFRGVPRRIVADQGPSFKSALITELCAKHGLGIEVELHTAGNAPATGAVESRHNWWQTAFETKLQYRAPPDLQTLNRWALECAAHRQATIPHTRTGKVPTEAWLDIRADELVECPSRDTFFALATKGERTGVLTHSLYLRVDGDRWEVSSPMAYAGMRVCFRLAPFLENGIRVWHPETREEFAAVPVEKRADRHGFYVGKSAILGGPRSHIWDDASAPGAAHAPTPGQRIAAAVKAGAPAASVAVPDLFDDLPQQLARHDFMARVGTAWAPSSETSSEPVLDHVSAREWIFAQLGRPPETPEEAAWWRHEIGDGLTASALRTLLVRFLDPHVSTPAVSAVTA